MSQEQHEVHQETTSRLSHLTFLYTHLILLVEQHYEMVHFPQKALNERYFVRGSESLVEED